MTPTPPFDAICDLLPRDTFHDFTQPRNDLPYSAIVFPKMKNVVP
jgi:hypothetical protein